MMPQLLKRPAASIPIVVVSTALCALVAFGGLVLADEGTEPAGKPRIVAQVEDTEITAEQLETELRHQLREQLDSFDKQQRAFLERQLLDRLIERKLLLVAAARAKLVPSDAEVKAFIDKMKMGLPEGESFEQELAKYGMSERAFATGLKEDLAIKEYLDRKVFGSLSLGRDEIESAFKADPQRYAAPEEVRARHILFKVAENATEQEIAAVKARAEQALREIKAAPAEFAQHARRISEADNAGKGGDLGFFSRNQMLEPFSEAAFKLKPGEISDLVRTRLGFHIIKVEERRGGETPKLEEVKDKVEATLLRERREKLLAQHFEELKKKYKVSVFYK